MDIIIPHEESVLGAPMELSSAASRLGLAHVDENEDASDVTLSPNEDVAAAAAARAAAENSQLFRKASLLAARQVLHLEAFIYTKGFTMQDVRDFLQVKSPHSSPVRDDFGLPIVGLSLVDDELTCDKNLNVNLQKGPSENVIGTAAAGGSTWADVVQSKKMDDDDDDDDAGVVFDYYPMPAGSNIVTPPDEVLRKGIEKFKNCLVGTFTKRTIPFVKVDELAHKAWGGVKGGLCSVSQKNANQYIFKFESEIQMNEILAKGTWYFQRKKPLVLSAWGKCSV